MTWEIA
jgi:diacylglycerol kinase (ATP)